MDDIVEALLTEQINSLTDLLDPNIFPAIKEPIKIDGVMCDNFKEWFIAYPEPRIEWTSYSSKGFPNYYRLEKVGEKWFLSTPFKMREIFDSAKPNAITEQMFKVLWKINDTYRDIRILTY